MQNSVLLSVSGNVALVEEAGVLHAVVVQVVPRQLHLVLAEVEVVFDEKEVSPRLRQRLWQLRSVDLRDALGQRQLAAGRWVVGRVLAHQVAQRAAGVAPRGGAPHALRERQVVDGHARHC